MSESTPATGSLVFKDIVAGYGDTRVLRGVAGAVGRGEVLCVVGRNGVGKTSLMRALTGFIPLMGGSVLFDGDDLARARPHARLGRGIAYSPQEDTVFTELTVEENLRLHRPEADMSCYAACFAAFPRLLERSSVRAGSLSGGERKLLAFSRTLALNADVTLIDEPTEGVQPENIDHMSSLVRARCGEGGAFIIVEQNLSFVLSTADHVLVLDHGEMRAAGSINRFSRADLEGHLVV